jgi:hypothetical protein
MREDDNHTRTRHAPHNLATLRNWALNVLNLSTAPASPAKRWRIIDRQPWRAAKTLGLAA